MSARSASAVAFGGCSCHLQKASVLPLRRIPHERCRSQASHIEQVYSLEAKLKHAGFNHEQARSLLLTSSRLSQIRQKADYHNIRRVFESSWKIEDEMIERGSTLKQARHMGCMFIALAATQLPKKTYTGDEYWQHWEVSARDVGNSLEAGGAKKHKGYDLATSMLNFIISDQKQ